MKSEAEKSENLQSCPKTQMKHSQSLSQKDT